MSDRMNQLLRQRALLQEHMAWLDREIAAALEKSESTPSTLELNRAVIMGAPLPPAVAVPSAPPVPTPLAFPATTPIVATTVTDVAASPAELASADAILEKYRVPSTNLQQDVRKGCFLYFAAAFALFGLIVAILYYMLRSR